MLACGVLFLYLPAEDCFFLDGEVTLLFWRGFKAGVVAEETTFTTFG